MKPIVMLVCLGVLGIVGCSSSSDLRKSARSQISQMNLAIRAYELHFGTYPPDLAEAAQFTGERFPEHDPWGRYWIFESFDSGFYLGSEAEVESDDSDDIYYDSEHGWSSDDD